MSDENLSVAQRAHQWIVGDDTGTSSRTLWSVMMGVPPPAAYTSPPLDPDDLGRCIRLLDAIPEWRRNLTKVPEVNSRWKPIVDHWTELEALYRHEVPDHIGSAPRLYARMDELLKS